MRVSGFALFESFEPVQPLAAKLPVIRCGDPGHQGLVAGRSKHHRSESERVAAGRRPESAAPLVCQCDGLLTGREITGVELDVLGVVVQAISSRAEGQLVAREVDDWLASAAPKSGVEREALLAHLDESSVSFAEWSVIDEHEQRQAGPGRVRAKEQDTETLLRIARRRATMAQDPNPESNT